MLFSEFSLERESEVCYMTCCQASWVFVFESRWNYST